MAKEGANCLSPKNNTSAINKGINKLGQKRNKMKDSVLVEYCEEKMIGK